MKKEKKRDIGTRYNQHSRRAPSSFVFSSSLQHVVNGSAHHSDHHTAYNYNYGQYFTLWDRIGGSYRHPYALSGKGCVGHGLSPVPPLSLSHVFFFSNLLFFSLSFLLIPPPPLTLLQHPR